jgi:diguanylate cyclase (GGDEF)-like protein
MAADYQIALHCLDAADPMATELTELGLKNPLSPEAPAPAPAPAAAARTARPEPAVEVARPMSVAAGAERRPDGLARFLARLCDVLDEFGPQADAADVEVFRARLDACRRAVSGGTPDTDVSGVAEEFLGTCREHLLLSRTYHKDREKELTELIGILRDAAKLSLGESAEFQAQMLASSSRFDAIAQLADIRDLRLRLGQEVGVLRKAVAEKQQRDEEAYAHLTRRVESLQAKLAELEVEVAADSLTRVANRGHFDRMLVRMVAQARQGGRPLSLAMVDVDHFKQINDTHGHPIGDRVLLCIAQLLAKSVRTTDVVARYGGEEFAVLMPGASVSEVEDRYQALLQEIAASAYAYDVLGRREVVRFTVSCGLTDLQGAEREEDLVKRADEALYEAKRRGRNRVVARKRSLFERMLARG